MPLKSGLGVIQGHGSIRYIDYEFLLAFHTALSSTISEIKRHTSANIIGL